MRESTLLKWAPVLTPVVIAFVGGWFNLTYQQTQAEAGEREAQRMDIEREERRRIDKANVVKDYFVYLSDNAQPKQQRAALAIMASLGYSDLVSSIVASNPTAENVSALLALASLGTGDAANSAIASLEAVRDTASAPDVVAAVDDALQRAQGIGLAGGGTRAVVAGADRTLPSAMDEVSRLESLGIEARVVARDGWFRTIVPVGEGADARLLLEQVRRKVRPSAYEVDLARWCGDDGANCVPQAPQN